MAYKLAIASAITLAIQFSLNDSGVTRQHKFQLICNRKDTEELRSLMQDENLLVKSVLNEVVTGWKDQKLVLNDDGTAAEFCQESFDLLLSIPGMEQVIYMAYLKEVGAKAKN